MPEVKAKRKFAFNPVVCRGCGFIVNKESYVEVDNGIYGGKAYHIKCQVQESENKEEQN